VTEHARRAAEAAFHELISLDLSPDEVDDALEELERLMIAWAELRAKNDNM
jgi:hypothetical protein